MKRSERSRRVPIRAAVEACEPRRLLAGVTGTVFADLNQNGRRDAGEAPLGNVGVFADKNGNGRFDPGTGEQTSSGPTNGAGFYRIDNLAADGSRYTIRLLAPLGTPTLGAAGYAFRPTKGAAVASGRDFGLFRGAANPPTAGASGTVFDDDNRNGVRDAGERASPGVTVYADLDYDGVKDADEPSALSSESGAYAIAGIGTSPYSVAIRVLTAPYFAVTGPASGFHSSKFEGAYVAGNRNFGIASVATTTIRGLLFEDTNLNGKRDAGEATLPGSSPYYDGYGVYADLNGNGVRDEGEPEGSTFGDFREGYVLHDVPVGKTVQIRVGYDSPAAGGYYQTAPAGYDAPITVTTTAAPVANVDFGFARLGTIAGRAAYDTNGNGKADALEPYAPGNFWLELNGNGVRDANEPLVSRVFEGSGMPPKFGPYSLAVPFGTYTLRAIGGDLAAPISFAIPALGDAPQVVTRNFVRVPPAPTTATISGTVFDDVNANGVRDAGEGGLGTKLVYADLDYDGVRDAGEPYALTRSNGNYEITGVPAGPNSVAVRLADVSTALVTTPAGGFHSGKFAAGATYANRNFGVRSAGPSRTASVTGTVYDDADNDGVRDAGEAGISGKTVWADFDQDGVIDAGEPTAVTDANGFYAITGIVTPKYSVAIRVDSVANELISAPSGGAHYGQFEGNVVAANRNFGIRRSAAPAPTAGASGVVWTDANLDRTYQPASESLLAGVTVYADLDGDGLFDAGESPVQGQLVFADLNGDGERQFDTEPSAFTDADGYYAFTGIPLSANSAQIRLGFGPISPYVVTTPAGGIHWAKFQSAYVAAGRNFGIAAP